MYTLDSRVSYSEVDEKGQLNIPGIINYLQDVTLFHSNDVGMDLDTLKQIQRAWLLSTWHIIFKRFPKMGERITIKTWPYQFKFIYGMRDYTIETDAGEVLAYGEAYWFLFDSEAGKPVPATENDIACYELGEKLDMESKSRKVSYPNDLTWLEDVLIYPNQLDTNHHVNNGEYVRISCNYLPNDLVVAELRVEYRNAAHEGDKISAYKAETDEAFYVILANENKQPYTIAEFKKGI